MKSIFQPKFILLAGFLLAGIFMGAKAHAGTIAISANVASGYCWNLFDGVGTFITTGCGPVAPTAVADGNYMIGVASYPPGYNGGTISGSANPAFAGTISWFGNFTFTPPPPLPTGNVNFRYPSGGTWMDGNTTLPYNSTIDVSWASSNSTNCTVYSNSTPIASPGTAGLLTNILLSPPGSYVVDLVCAGPGGTAWVDGYTITVSPPAAPTGNVNWRHPSGVTWGDGNATFPFNSTMDITWASTNATTCNVLSNGAITGPTSTASAINAIALSAAGNYLIQLRCSGPGGTDVIVDGYTITVSPPAAPTGNVNWRHPSGGAGGDGNATFPFNSTMDITWASTNATTCNVLSNGVVTGPTSTANVINGIALSAAGNYLIQLRCTGPGGTDVIVDGYTITVSPPPVPVITSFTFSPSTVAWNTGSTVSWATTNATACSVPGFAATGPSGTNVAVGPFTGTGTYTMTCTGPGGSSAPVSRTITVTGGPPAPSGPNSLEQRINDSGSFTGGNITVPYGGTVEYRWGATVNTTSCYLSPLEAVPAFNGLTNAQYSGDGEEYGPLNAPGVYLANLVCSGPGGTNLTVDSVQTTVGPAPTSSVDLKINGSDGPITYPYNTMNIPASWVLANVTTCSSTSNGVPLASGITVSGSAAWPGPFIQPTTLVLTCTNPYGPAVSDSVLITMSGTININSNLPGLTWTLTGPQNFSTTANSIPDAIFGAYTLTVPVVTGYDAVITPCNPQNLNQTATACD